jgi:hypothetical protein
LSSRISIRRLVGIVAALAAGPEFADAGSPSPPEEWTRIPALVARALPTVVSITARRIDKDQFSTSTPKAGRGSRVVVDR